MDLWLPEGSVLSSSALSHQTQVQLVNSVNKIIVQLSISYRLKTIHNVYYGL